MLYMATGKPAHLGCLLLTHLTKTYNLSEPAYLWPYTVYVVLMMGEIVTRNMYSKAIAENKNAIIASC